MVDRVCYKCKRGNGKGARELRPYGPNGQDICAGCVFGEDGNSPNPEAENEAKRQLTKRVMSPGPHVLDPDVGPIPLRKHTFKGQTN